MYTETIQIKSITTDVSKYGIDIVLITCLAWMPNRRDAKWFGSGISRSIKCKLP